MMRSFASMTSSGLGMRIEDRPEVDGRPGRGKSGDGRDHAALRSSSLPKARRSRSRTRAGDSSRLISWRTWAECSQAAEVPGEVLARHPHADHRRIVPEHLLIVLKGDLHWRSESGGSGRDLVPVIQIGDHLTEEPRPAIGAPPDHHAVRAGQGQGGRADARCRSRRRSPGPADRRRP